MKRKIVAAALVIAGLCGINSIVSADGEEYNYTVSGENCKLTKYLGDDAEVVIPSKYKGYNVVTLSGTFQGNEKLKKVVIPDSVNLIYDHTFNSCSTLETVEFSSSVNKIGFDSFRNCTSLTSINIPGNIKTIDTGAFSLCSNLSSVTLNEGVKTIYSGAFENCDKLESIYIPKSVTFFEPAFGNCDNLSKIIVDEDNELFESPVNSNAVIRKNNKSLIQGCKDTIVPDGVKSMALPSIVKPAISGL